MSRAEAAASWWRSTNEAFRLARILTGLLLAAGAWALIFEAPGALVVVAAVAVSALALREFYEIGSKSGLDSFRVAGHTAAALWIVTPNLDRGYFATLVVLAILGTAILGRSSGRAPLPTAAVTLTGVVYLAGPFVCGLHLHDMSPHWLAFTIVVVALGDSAALGIGRVLGRHPLAPETSPKKTWEGAIASVVAGSLAGCGYVLAFLPGERHLAEVAVLAPCVNIASQIGDIAESALKRSAGMKDSGSLLPGHGGVLDRIDSLLFALPVAYGYLQYLG